MPGNQRRLTAEMGAELEYHRTRQDKTRQGMTNHVTTITKQGQDSQDRNKDKTRPDKRPRAQQAEDKQALTKTRKEGKS